MLIRVVTHILPIVKEDFAGKSFVDEAVMLFVKQKKTKYVKTRALS